MAYGHFCLRGAITVLKPLLSKAPDTDLTGLLIDAHLARRRVKHVQKGNLITSHSLIELPTMIAASSFAENLLYMLTGLLIKGHYRVVRQICGASFAVRLYAHICFELELVVNSNPNPPEVRVQLFVAHPCKAQQSFLSESSLSHLDSNTTRTWFM